MASEILRGIAADIKDVDVAIAEAEDLINAMKEAGESVAEMEPDLRELKIRKIKWAKMLSSRGLM